jgi:hypothetical protein
MITYTVKYKLPNQWFWRTIKNVMEDGVVEDSHPSRYFHTKNKKRYEVSCSCTFIFDEEREERIAEIKEKDRNKI